jgi:hypothetical protein
VSPRDEIACLIGPKSLMGHRHVTDDGSDCASVNTPQPAFAACATESLPRRRSLLSHR